ncbi:MAG: biopolymer transport protein TolR [Pyrinomonadaceae bacterium]|nr:biopolymer transport protein TolR [Pyrinomonadaceae bacterium]MDX6271206.1 biopolymer transport protein TolR [Acidobacteriota bacterium]
MGMSGGGADKYNSEINVTPMVDIMLVLLIIFMVVTPLLQSGVSVALPKDMNNPEVDKAIIKESSVVISITADNQYYIGKDKVETVDLGGKITKSMETKKPEERIVYIKSDVGANYGSVVEVINTVRQAGIDQIGLVADKKKGGAPAAAPAAAS